MDEFAYSLVTESFNVVDGQSFAGLAGAMAALRAIAARGDAEILVTDAIGDGRVQALAAEADVPVRVIDAAGLDYDAQKNRAAEAARGHYLAFLDGDCRPLHDDWLERLTAPLRDGTADAVGGLTLYDDSSPGGIAATVMDFGYVWDQPDGRLGCYTSNNVAFLRSLRCELPVAEDSGLRCNCYAHAQALLRDGRRLRFAADAVVLHEPPDVAKERYRRGWDLVAACWSNPLQIETAQLHPTEAAFHWRLRRLQHLDAVRVRLAPAAVGIDDGNRGAVLGEIARLRRMEAVGLRDALLAGEADGRNAAARAAFAHWQAARRSAGAT